MRRGSYDLRCTSRKVKTMTAWGQPAGIDQPVAIEIQQICKSYGATRAVDDVSITIARGSAHALLGENGAGKSTLVKLLAGLVTPDSGQIQVLGARVSIRNPKAAHALGIHTAFQEMTHIKDLTVLDNLLLPYGPTNWLGILDRRAAGIRIRAFLDELGLHAVDLQEEIQNLDLAVQQKLEIARALLREPRILLLDESTSTLSGTDVQWIGELIAAQRRKGVTVVFITHRLPEVRSFCDSMTVLRNGQHIASGAVSDFTDAQVIEMIIGRKLEHNKAARAEAGKAQGAEVLGAQDLATSGKLQSASFSLHTGEILGVAGLQGMGQRDLFLACFGMAEISGGTLRVDGVDAVVLSPSQAIQAGICLVPEDRKTEGLFLELNGRHNASMPVIQRFIGGGLIDYASETDAVGAVFDRLDIDRRALWTQVKAFSGGNQQKIAIAKWFVAESRILLLYDPTRGIDVGTKNEIYQLIRAFAQAGGAVLLYSTEIPELVHLADRVMVFYGGRVCAEIAGEDLSEKALLRAALGNTAEAGVLA